MWSDRWKIKIGEVEGSYCSTLSRFGCIESFLCSNQNDLPSFHFYDVGFGLLVLALEYKESFYVFILYFTIL